MLLVMGMAMMSSPARADSEAERRAVIKTYADIAQAVYEDSHASALIMANAIDAFLAKPGDATLRSARDAWKASRVPYQQSEAYRFGNPIVDDWEGRVNAWPLDEGLLDNVAASYGMESGDNPFYTANVIANKQLTINGETVDISRITPELLSETLREVGDVEANVSTGYHAIEFLLWGQDLNGTKAGAGNRPWTDYIQGNGCTNGSCDRRAAYLKAATRLLIDDLAVMAKYWAPGGEARQAVEDAEPNIGLSAILTGLGSLSYGELAGERMKLGLTLHDPEEEHDCFSDNTFYSHYYDIVGMNNVYRGEYKRIDGRTVKGASLAALVQSIDKGLAAETDGKMAKTLAVAGTMKQRGETVEAYDQMIGEGNAEGNAVVQAVIDALVDQTRSFERIVAVLKLDPIAFEGSDSLNDPANVFK